MTRPRLSLREFLSTAQEFSALHSTREDGEKKYFVRSKCREFPRFFYSQKKKRTDFHTYILTGFDQMKYNNQAAGTSIIPNPKVLTVARRVKFNQQ